MALHMLEQMEVGSHMTYFAVVAQNVLADMLHAQLKHGHTVSRVFSLEGSAIAEPAHHFRRKISFEMSYVVLNPPILVVASEYRIAFEDVSKLAPQLEWVSVGPGFYRSETRAKSQDRGPNVEATENTVSWKLLSRLQCLSVPGFH